MAKRYLLLEVDESRCTELETALRTRSYVKTFSLPLSRQDREGTCKVCYHSFTKSKTISVTEELVCSMLRILIAINKYKTVVLIPQDREPSFLQKERTLFMSEKLLASALQLNLLKKFMDGAQETYYITKIGLDFLSGNKKLDPARYIITDGLPPEPCDSLHVTEVKFKDLLAKDLILANIRTAIFDMPEKIKNFIINGQLVLI
jgi:hypothetical protein